MIVERMSGDSDLDAVAALEASSFTNPWTREMLERELVQPTSARVYVLRLPDAGVAAFCSCWVIADELHINTITRGPPLESRRARFVRRSGVRGGRCAETVLHESRGRRADSLEANGRGRRRFGGLGAADEPSLKACSSCATVPVLTVSAEAYAISSQRRRRCRQTSKS